jgi:methylisocitrate lyase
VFPKRCGHFEGKRVVPTEEMVLKLRAALRSRRDADFVIVARTDAREPNGIDDAIDRVNRYCDAGADVAFVEAPLSVGELEAVARRVPAPKLVNMLPFGKTPILAAPELEAMGYKIVVAPIETVLVTARAVMEAAGAFLREGHTRALSDRMVSFAEIKDILGVEEYLSLREDLSRS